MPKLRSLGTLRLDAAPAPRMPRFVSAASGLVHVGKLRYLVVDDLHDLAVFADGAGRAGSLVRLFPGNVPSRKKARKKVKRDLESLVRLPVFDGFPHGALLALGSGSRPRRRAGALVALDEEGGVCGVVKRIDLTGLYRALGDEFAEINVEGAFVDDSHLCLLQRANVAQPRNSRIRVDLQAALGELSRGRSLSSKALVDVTDYALPGIDGIPLGFTDGAALADGGFAFTAVAEHTDDAYADGPCAGSAIGIVDAGDVVEALWQLRPALKVEGIAVVQDHQAMTLEVVTDADDPKAPARLLTVSLPRLREISTWRSTCFAGSCRSRNRSRCSFASRRRAFSMRRRSCAR